MAKAGVSLGYDVVVTHSHDELEKYKDLAQMTIVEDSTLKSNLSLLDPGYRDKVYLNTYWQFSNPCGLGSEYQFNLSHALIPYVYAKSNPNAFIGSFVYPMISDHEKPYDSTFYRGCLWGKNAGKQCDFEFIDCARKSGISFYATTEDSVDCDNVKNLGVLRLREFHGLLNSIRFVYGFGNPAAGPTILEALYFDCLLVSPSQQVPFQLRSHPNIIFTDGMSTENVISVLQSIDAGKIHPVPKRYPKEFTFTALRKRLRDLIDRPVGSEICESRHPERLHDVS